MPRPASTIESEALAELVRAELPDYMVPSAFVILDTLPLTPTGKIDRAALPDPFVHRAETGRGGPPIGGIEQTLARVWSELLGIADIQRDDDFFADLGGHSLLVTRLLAAIQRVMEVELPVSALFEAPTVAKLASALQSKNALGPQLKAPAIGRVTRDARHLPSGDVDS